MAFHLTVNQFNQFNFNCGNPFEFLDPRSSFPSFAHQQESYRTHPQSYDYALQRAREKIAQTGNLYRSFNVGLCATIQQGGSCFPNCSNLHHIAIYNAICEKHQSETPPPPYQKPKGEPPATPVAPEPIPEPSSYFGPIPLRIIDDVANPHYPPEPSTQAELHIGSRPLITQEETVSRFIREVCADIFKKKKKLQQPPLD